MKTAVDGDDEATSARVNAATTAAAAMLREFLITSTRRATEGKKEGSEQKRRNSDEEMGKKSVIIAASVAFVCKSQKERQRTQSERKRDMRENRGRSLQPPRAIPTRKRPQIGRDVSGKQLDDRRREREAK